MNFNTDKWGASRRAFVSAAGALALSSVAALALAKPKARVIKIVAKKFEFLPHEVTLKKGVPVILEFTTADVAMGFNAPDFKVRTDILPGKVAQLRIVPRETGSFEYLCDVFCGSGHEEMSGKIIVVA